MVEQMLTYERDAFFALNGCHTPFWDNFMWLYSGKFVWLPLGAFIILMLVYKKDWRQSLLILLSIGLLVLLCDQFSSHICKPYFMRFRPTHHPDFMNEVKTVFDYRGGRYGFISGHATNAFGFAMLTALIFRNKLYSVTIFLWAALTAYSRIYLGVHFITDILFGTLAGLFFGGLVYFIYTYAQRNWLSMLSDSQKTYSKSRIYSICAAIGFMVVLMALFNQQLVDLLR